MPRTLVLSALLLALSCGDPADSDLHEPGASAGRTGGSGGRAGGSSSSGDAGAGGSGESGMEPGGGGSSDGGDDGSGAEGGDGKGGGKAGMGGSSAAGGKAGESGTGGGGGKPISCEEHLAAVNKALLEAQACNPATDIEHCTGTVQDLCGCPQPVERQDSEATRAYQAAVKAAQDAGCAIFCAAISCIEPGPGICMPSSGRCAAAGLGI